MKRTRGSFVLVVATQALAAFLIFAFGLPARQAAPSQAVKQDDSRKLPLPPPPVQPIPYSHKKHLAFGLNCQFCHGNPDPGIQMKFPETATCMACHVTVAKDKPAIQKLAEFSKSQKPIPWVRVYVVLPGVYWTHRAHLQAGMKCEMCHGEVAEMDVMAQVTNVTGMFGCVDCHEKSNAKVVCDTCHKN